MLAHQQKYWTFNGWDGPKNSILLYKSGKKNYIYYEHGKCSTLSTIKTVQIF